MARTMFAGLCAGLVLSAVGLSAQGGTTPGTYQVTSRQPAMPIRGIVVEVSCFRKMGGGSAETPEAIACAKAAVKAGGIIGVLSEGDGMFKIVGSLALGGYSKLTPHIGKTISLTGQEVILSNNYDYRSYEAKSFTPVAAGSAAAPAPVKK